MPKKIIILLCIFIFIINGLIYANYKPENVEVIKPIRCNVNRNKNVQANVVPYKDLQISAGLGGIINKIKVREGERVKKGDILIIFKQDRIKALMKQAQASLEIAESNFEMLKNSSTEEEIELAKSSYDKALASYENAKKNLEFARSMYEDKTSKEQQLLSAKTNLETAEKQFEIAKEKLKQSEENLQQNREKYYKMEELYKKDVIPKNEFDKAKINYQNAQSAYKSAQLVKEEREINYNSAREKYKLAKEIYDNPDSDKKKIEGAKSQLKIAKANLEMARINMEKVFKGASKEEIDIKKANIQKARAALEEIELQLDECIVKSPIDGIVTKINVNKGEMVGAGSRVITVVNTARLNVTTKLSTKDIRFLQRGDYIKLNFLEFPGHRVYGKITEISPILDNKGMYSVKILINNNNNLIKPGMKALLKLNSQETEIEIFFEDGQKEKFAWKFLEEKNKDFSIQGENRIEYVNLDLPPGVRDENFQNNNWSADLWSPELKIETTNIKPEYSYLVDKQGNTWLVFCNRVNKNKKPQIFLDIISPEGNYLIKRKRLSKPGEYSVNPDIVANTSDAVYMTWSSYHNSKDVVNYCKARLGLEGFNIINKKIIGIPNGAITNPSLHLINEQVHILYKKKVEKEINSEIYFSCLNINDKKSGELFSMLISKGDYSFDRSQGDIFYNNILQDSKGNIYYIWGNKSRWTGDVYLNKIDSEGNIVIENKKIKSLLMTAKVDFSLNCEIINDRLHLMWVEHNNVNQELFEQNHLILNLKGEPVKEEYRITQPSEQLVNGINMTPDNNNNLNLVWSDERKGEPSPNQEIIYTKIDEKGNIIVPRYRLTTGKIDDFNPRLYETEENTRYIIWNRFEDGKYSFYLKNTDPRLKRVLEDKNIFKNLMKKIYPYIVTIFISMGSVFLFFVPFNIIPIIGILCYFQWLTSYYSVNNIYILSGVSLGLIPLKILNERIIVDNFTNLMKITLEDIYLINISSFMIFAILSIIIAIFKNKEHNIIKNLDIQALFMALWILTDTFIIMFVNLIQYI